MARGTDEVAEDPVNGNTSGGKQPSDMENTGEAYGIVGYPGAGKSEAGRLLSNEIGGINIETGNIVRQGAEQYFGMPSDEILSDDLGDYSTMRRERDGGDYVAQDVITKLTENKKYPDQPAVITGIRDTEAIPPFEEFFNTFQILWIHAEFGERLHRLQKRDRQDESGFTKAELAERDGKESMWGVGDLTFMADYRVDNSGSIIDLQTTLEDISF